MRPTSFLSVFIPALTQAALTYKGVDWSSVLVEESAGVSYSGSSGTTRSLEKIFANNGVNTVRQRLWVNPSDGNYNLDYNLEIAQRAHAQGLTIYLDIHFSDTWADPSHQTTPTAWQGYGVDDLATEVQNYTMSVMNAFHATDIPLSLVSIGNEITAGMLWPTGQMNKSGGSYNLATLLHAASAGIKQSDLDTTPQIMIHLDNGWEWDTQSYWYETVLGEGPLTTDDFDVHGVSYYPFYNEKATLAALKDSLEKLHSAYGKSVMVVETDWPTSCPDPAYEFPSDTTDIPFSAAGQTTWLQDIASIVEEAGGDGVFYWEPAWLDNAALGSSCEYNTMFSTGGQALDSMGVFSDI